MKNNRKKIGRGTLALIITVAVIAAVVLYVTLLLKPVQEKTEQVRTEKTEVENLYLVEQKKAEQIDVWKEYLTTEGVKESSIETYDNAKTELKVLNAILEKADTYSVTFDDSYTKDGVTVRRPLTLSFMASNYGVAHSIIYNIEHGEFRCMIKDIKIKDKNNYLLDNVTGFNGNADPVQVSVSMYYIETLMGAEDDSGVLYIQQETVTYDEESIY